MPRTTATAVGLIIEVDAAISLDPFIEVASALVDDACSGASYSAEKLERIERWLSAHFYTVRDPRAESEKAGAVSAKYQSKVDIGLNSSHYGQMAMRLDTNGGLAKLEKDIKEGRSSVEAGIFWLGGES